MGRQEFKVSYIGGIAMDRIPEAFLVKLRAKVDSLRPYVEKRMKDNKEDFHPGYRWSDTNRVILATLSNVVDFHGFDRYTFDVDAFVGLYDDAGWETWLFDGLRYSASCDHWYAFEKQWD